MPSLYKHNLCQPDLFYHISNKINLNIIHLTFRYSLLYFTDDNQTKISIPNNIILYECDAINDMYKIAIEKINNELYHLCDTTPYKIELDYNIILEINGGGNKTYKLNS